MFIEQGIKSENKFWKYIVGSVIIIFASLLGQVPLLIALFYEIFVNGKKYPSSNEDVMTFFEPNMTLFLILISFVFAMLGIFFVIKYLHNQTMLSITTSRLKMDWSRVFFSFSVWSIFTIVSTVLFYFSNPDDFIINFKPIPFAILALIGTLLIPIQTSTEEYIFRGYLMQGFANLAKNKWFPLIMTSIIFGAMHISNPEVSKIGNVIFVYYIGTGLLLGIITLMDEGMELALGFHAANNLVSALLITSDWSAFQTHSIFKDVSEPSAGLDVILPVIIIYPILLFIFSKKYKWTNWKEKLTGKIEEPTPYNHLKSI
ncbi:MULTISPECIES: CPBP family intramembrane glutamic endopeptidase [Flavobacterium]|uniref:CPBP family intramembrane metalloprotease n=1 Tax=Flavobacterium gawalongense TaxID=2594432 RepID=A0A553BS37_9FLAO|nr:CPBP family intramembrane glutamic endopeptidase [Flavobacterium gawalongense]TRX03151.1 CPBP family intramembrane metalloprotease [Flavobacterium gawalongense]TRX09813.1 CPBP family intramembrane metalloprotease [Flavobacterium gawalongense]TRX11039.1 CPBP family intramembrane metalloprotease [Flavobacterium gawalongense]TRX11998.1 CPBP family intramembrane metalloprotease [Flavobacterium gawalongense]TRX29844.1 CPBP family intramembrane metalloprotease [Flavobacterium gawalongense]